MMWIWILLAVAAAIVLMNITTGEKKVQRRIKTLYSVSDPPFSRSIGTLLGPALRHGNLIEPLINGKEIFPAMLAAIRAAEKTITFETFIYWSGEIGKEFAEALSEKARGGVRVHVLLDWVGSYKMEGDILDGMREAGVQVEKYHPLRWYNVGRMNNRTHRKLLVVDGTIGFTGGVGIADNWTGGAEDPEHWRDNHFKVEGPVVAQMQAAFMDNWIKTRGEVLHGDDYFPELKEVGESHAQLFRSSSLEGSESARLMFLLSIASAKESVRISASYFVPDDLSLHTLVDAKTRGAKVTIIVPGDYIDTKITRRASRARWGRLLGCGIEIREYQPTMYHTKTMIIDSVFTSVGSTNFDTRSFRLNDEANLNILDPTFAKRMVEVFEEDLTKARQITFEEWKHRPLRERMVERLAALFRSQL